MTSTVSKKWNDTLGHDSGDLLLQQVEQQRLRSLLRESDTVARLGGDEFVIGLMLMASIDDAIQVANKVVAEIARPFTLPRGVANIGASVGISICTRTTATMQEAYYWRPTKPCIKPKSAGRTAIECMSRV